MWRLPKGRTKRPDEVSLGDGCNTRQSFDVQRLGVAAVDHVSGAQHAAVQLLNGPSHG